VGKDRSFDSAKDRSRLLKLFGRKAKRDTGGASATEMSARDAAAEEAHVRGVVAGGNKETPHEDPGEAVQQDEGLSTSLDERLSDDGVEAGLASSISPVESVRHEEVPQARPRTVGLDERLTADLDETDLADTDAVSVEQRAGAALGAELKPQGPADVLALEAVMRRTDLAAEGILGNQRLTANLDDSAASELLDWGVACAEEIAQGTAGLDDQEAEEFMYPRLRATRRLMREVNRWVAQQEEMDTVGIAESLDRIVEEAVIAYGQDLTPAVAGERALFLQRSLQHADDPRQAIADLRAFVERVGHRSAPD
jgi:hypothetical protein